MAKIPKVKQETQGKNSDLDVASSPRLRARVSADAIQRYQDDMFPCAEKTKKRSQAPSENRPAKHSRKAGKQESAVLIPKK